MVLKDKVCRRLALLRGAVTVAGGFALVTACERPVAVAGPLTSVPVASVVVSPAAATIAIAHTVQLTATPKDANGNPLSGRVVTWASSNTAVATDNGYGLVTGVALGLATITATSGGQSGTAAITVTNVPPPPSGGAWPNENILSTYPNQRVLTDWGLDQVPPINSPLNNGVDILGSPGPWQIVYNAGSPNVQGWVELQADPNAPQSPPNVYAFVYPAGYTSGHAPATVFFTAMGSPGPTELYMGFWWKVSNPWTDAAATNKIVFLFPTVSGHQIFLSMKPTEHVIQLGDEWGGGLEWPNVNATAVSLGVWHRVEWYVNIVGPGASIAKWWLDGVLQGSYSDRSWSGATWSMFQFSPTWGGLTSYPVPQTQYYWFDHVHISRP